MFHFVGATFYIFDRELNKIQPLLDQFPETGCQKGALWSRDIQIYATEY